MGTTTTTKRTPFPVNSLIVRPSFPANCFHYCSVMSLYSTTFILLSANGEPTDGYIQIESLPQKGNGKKTLGRAKYVDDESAEDLYLWFSEDSATLVAWVGRRNGRPDNRNPPFKIKMIFEAREVVALRVHLRGCVALFANEDRLVSEVEIAPSGGLVPDNQLRKVLF